MNGHGAVEGGGERFAVPAFENLNQLSTQTNAQGQFVFDASTAVTVIHPEKIKTPEQTNVSLIGNQLRFPEKDGREGLKVDVYDAGGKHLAQLFDAPPGCFAVVF